MSLVFARDLNNPCVLLGIAHLWSIVSGLIKGQVSLTLASALQKKHKSLCL